MDLIASLGIVGILFAAFLAILPLLLLARCSHWTYHTQRKLDETNALLKKLIER